MKVRVFPSFGLIFEGFTVALTSKYFGTWPTKIQRLVFCKKIKSPIWLIFQGSITLSHCNRAVMLAGLNNLKGNSTRSNEGLYPNNGTFRYPPRILYRPIEPQPLQTVDSHPTQQQFLLWRGWEDMLKLFDPARSMQRGRCSGLFQRRKVTGKIAFVLPYFPELSSKRRPFYKQPLVWQRLQRIRDRRLCIYYATAFR